MPRKPNPKPDDETQSKRFLETAKLVEADKTGKNFQKALDVIAPPSDREDYVPTEMTVTFVWSGKPPGSPPAKQVEENIYAGLYHIGGDQLAKPPAVEVHLSVDKLGLEVTGVARTPDGKPHFVSTYSLVTWQGNCSTYQRWKKSQP